MGFTNSTSAAVHGGSEPPSLNTTFVQADPSTFRTIVQKLTGAPENQATEKLPITHSTRPLPVPSGPKRPGFKLNERRPSAKNLQINLGNSFSYSPDLFQLRQQMQRSGGFMVSPVSTLDFMATRMSPGSPSCEEEEERAIAEKGFYLHPVSPLGTPRGSDPPQLLPLFPLSSPSSDIAR